MKTTCQTAWKRVVTALLLCALLLCLCACGGVASSVKKAPLKGHETPLADAINSTIEQLKDDDEFKDDDKKFSLDWENGWSGEGAPEQSTLGDGEKAVTLFMRTTKGDETRTVAFFLAYNTLENTLTAKGGRATDSEGTDTVSAAEANSLLELFCLSESMSNLTS